MTTLLLLTISGTAVAQNNLQSIPAGDNTKEELSTPKLNSSPRIYVYPDNSLINISRFDINRRKIEQRKLKAGLQYKSIRLVKYNEYLEERRKRNLDVIENLQVHPNRQVFLVEIDAPSGLEISTRHMKLKPRIGVDGRDMNEPQPESTRIKKAKLFFVFDAETNQILSSDIIGVNEL
ncbi:hypothetical protein H6G75_13870 [Nostoc sp. FACHB-280]|nr:hypothetical protein [Nostoc sp. FACHB-280]